MTQYFVSALMSQQTEYIRYFVHVINFTNQIHRYIRTITNIECQNTFIYLVNFTNYELNTLSERFTFNSKTLR